MRKFPGRITALKLIRRLDGRLCQLDEWLCDLGPSEDDDDQPLERRRVAELTLPGGLHNGNFGVMPVKVVLSFDEKDPFAVQMEITISVTAHGKVVGSDSTAWDFARDLLDTALSRNDLAMVGDGDLGVQYIPSEEQIRLWLTHIDGRKIRMDLAAKPVRQFMEASFDIFPHDAEAEFDSELDKILGREK